MTFDRLTPVWHLGPDPKPLRYGHPKDRVWLLWPVRAFRVILPRLPQRALNLFQEAAIQLCRVGVRSATEVGERLGLGTGLAAVVLLELQQMEHLDADGRPTPRGLAELEGHATPGTTVGGWVFADAVGGELWPRFTELRPAAAEVERSDARVFHLNLGTPSDPQREKAQVVGARRDPAAPGAREVLNPYLDHARTQRAVRGVAEKKAYTERVVVLGDGLDVYLTTYLFTPHDEGGVAEWQVCDPFGFGVSHALRLEVERAARDDEALDGRIEELHRKTLPGEDEEAFAQRRRAAEEEAWQAVVRELGPPPPDEGLEALRVRLCRLEQRWRGRDTDFVAYKDFVQAAYQAAEQALSDVLTRYPGESGATAAGLTQEAPDVNAAVLADVAAKVGFEEIDAAFYAVRAGAVRAAHGGGDLRGRFAAALASANDRLDHPLWRLAREWPGAAGWLARLKSLRDPLAHAGAVRSSAADDVREGSYRLVRGLFPHLRHEGRQEATAASLGPQVNRVRACRRAERRFGPGLRRDEGLRFGVVELLTRHEELRGDRRPDPFACGLLIVSGCAAVEEVMGRLAVGDVGPLGTKRENAQRFERAVTALGFEVGTGDDWADLTHPQPDHLRKALRLGKSTLNAVTVAAVLVAERSEAGDLRRAASERPAMLREIAELSAARGHGGPVALTADQMDRYTNLFLDVIYVITRHAL